MGNFSAKLCLTFILVVCALQAQDSSASGPAQPTVPRIPGQITAQDAAALEAGLAAHPDNLAAREHLIKYYFDEMIASRSSVLEDKREKHVFWLIEHAPESELAGSPETEIMPIGFSGSMEGYERGKQLWLEQVEKHPDNQQILRNAARFFSLSEGKLATGLLEKASALDPSDAETASSLAQSYEQERMKTTLPEDKTALAKKALSLRERALEKAEGEQRFYELGPVAKSALEAGEPEKGPAIRLRTLTVRPKIQE